MVQWKLVCGLMGLYAATTVKAMPIEQDEPETTDELLSLDDSHPALGTWLPDTNMPTSATLGANGAPSGEYNPGQLHAPRVDRRRLEVTKSTDMKKLETFFGLELETDITKLPTKYEHNPIPWPSSYWPTYADSINYRWKKGEASPSEKYAKAFGHDVTSLMDKVSAKNGVDSKTKRRACTEEADCKDLKDGSLCAKREGKKSGHCIPKWFGICHAWAPAAILEAEPVCAVTRNGTTFEVYDIKALLTMAYDDSKIPTIFTGARFNGEDKAPNNTDEYGRFHDAKRRDISPGYFHVAVTNIMGRFNHSFVVDISAGKEVWNQPVRGYEILRLAWTTPTAAAKKYFKVDKYPFNDAATKIAVVTTRFRWIVESGVNGPLVSTGIVDKYTTSADYDYILETDETYQILGGEWISGSMANHPDFLWLPASKPDNATVTPIGLVYSEIESLLDESTHGDCKSPSKKTAPVPKSDAASTGGSAATSADTSDADSTEGSAGESPPASTGGSAPDSTDGSAPASTGGSAPASAEGSAPASAEGSAPASAEGSAPASAEGSAPASAEGSAPASTEAPTDDSKDESAAASTEASDDGSKDEPVASTASSTESSASS